MFEGSPTHASVLKDYSRPIVHMRKQVELRRFGLFLGAGVSKPLGLPNWESLVRQIAADPDVDAEGVLDAATTRAGLPYLTELVFEHYRRNRYAAAPPEERHTRDLDSRIGGDWREIVRRLLYASATGPLGDCIENHPYLDSYLNVIKNTAMTVTYNFDDFIEQAIMSRRAEGDQARGFESVTNPWTQFRRQTGVIYHPNGVIPQNPLETPSDQFVFSEASYAEQLMGVYSGDQSGLLSHLSRNTCLLVGLSLEDDTLRSILAHASRSCPGNFHYYVQYTESGSLDDEEKEAIRRANFKVYNLVTLFLDEAGIRALGEMLDIGRCTTDDFVDFAAVHSVPVRFRYYLTGPLGVGKSTTINFFRNLVVLDEWLDERPPVLAKDWEALTPEETEEADNWVASQFRQKNDRLRNSKEGIFLLDRGPLDPLAFTPDEKRPQRASQLLQAICPGEAGWLVEGGHVVNLKGDCAELALRMVLSQRKDYTADKLSRMSSRLHEAYGVSGVTTFDARGLAPHDVARRLAEIIHLEPYDSCDLHERLNEIAGD